MRTRFFDFWRWFSPMPWLYDGCLWAFAGGLSILTGKVGARSPIQIREV